jgi:hypothetical protein
MECAMMILRTLFILCARVFAVVGAAIATMMLGWIITAHAASLVPDEPDRENSILCERIPDMICQPDVPGLVTRPATLAVPDKRRPVWARGAGAAGRTLTNF